jgi:peptidoglycan/LPS O-acetylase OafA/YrhL
VANRHGYFDTFEANVWDAIAAIAQVYNFHTYQCLPHGSCGSLGMYWSLSLEEQFYMIFPIVLTLAPNRKILYMLLGAAFLAQFIYHRPDGFDPLSPSLLWFVRTDAIILGVAIALWKKHGGATYVAPKFLRNRLGAFGFVALCLVLLTLLPSKLDPIPFSTGLIAVVCAFLVFVASHDRNFILPPSLFKTALIWIGARSYSIYLAHMPVYYLLKELSDDLYGPDSIKTMGLAYSAFFMCVFFAATLTISHLNFRFIETPLRRKGRKIAENYGRA